MPIQKQKSGYQKQATPHDAHGRQNTQMLQAQPECGGADGEDAEQDHAIDAIDAAWEQYGADSAGIVLLGQSFGGLIVLGLAASQPDVPLLGVSTHGTGLRWLPGALQRFQSLLAEAPFVQLPFDENARSLGPANSWVHEARERLKQSRAPLPMAELREVLRFPQRLRQISADVRVPVQMILGEYDTTWESSASALDELSQLFPQAPFVDVRR
ncbi:alpha/beta fold hydrolase [Ktedonobacter racemifer]|uniref:alpha/beta fold hydrolase n=1 Tax=Ktedonobacter racemifer TaxID=363277 RepID=UPI00146C9EA3|nr:alpha/beta hydrolase [Ktedonobacter racemifer]